MIIGYKNFLFKNKVKLFFYRVAEFLTLLWIFMVFYILMVVGNI